MKTELKEGIFIVGCNSLFELRQSLFPKNGVVPFDAEIIYEGKTLEIPRNIAKQYFDWGYDDLEVYFKSLDESIQSACSEEYCIIYKIK